MNSKSVQMNRWHFSASSFWELCRIAPSNDHIPNKLISFKRLSLNIVFGYILGFFLFVPPVSAYIDPGMTSMVWQLMLATLLGAAYAARLRWAKIKDAFRKLFKRST